MIFNPSVYSYTIRRYIRFYIIKIKVKAYITIKLPVNIIAGITFFRTPHSLSRFYISSKSGNATFAVNRSKYTIFWSGRPMEDTVSICYKKLYPCIF